MPKGEPTTEEEAQEMKRFLERGAKASIESVRRLPSPPAKLAANLPLALAVPDVGNALEELGSKGGGEGDVVTETVAVVELELAQPRIVPNYSVNVFVNKRDANAQTSVEDPSFVGSVAFFCHATLENGELVCTDHGEGPAIFRLPIPEEAARSAGRGPLSVTLVPVPFDGSRKPIEPIDAKVTIDIVRSEFARAT